MNNVHVHVPFLNVGEHLPLIRQHRLNLEIFFSAQALDSLRTGDIEALRNSLDHRPSISIHAPFMDLSPGAQDPKVREVTRQRFFHVLDIAEIMQPKVIVFHSGYEKWKYAHRVDLWLEPSLAFWEPLIERASLIGTKLAIENIFEDDPSNLSLLVQRLRSPAFGICFDTGHCNLFSRVPLSEWLDTLGPYIFELHLHDNDGSFDSHLPIGDGDFDFATLFPRIETRDVVMTIEAHTPERVLRSLDRLVQHITIRKPGS